MKRIPVFFATQKGTRGALPRRLHRCCGNKDFRASGALFRFRSAL